MKVLQIKSVGEIEPQALKLIGATTKSNDNTKIGMFGSGLKYSIAFFLRNKIDFRVFSGTREIMISTIDQEFRREKFEVVTIDGEPTSITTKMGENDWGTTFMAIREIYSNAMDEGEYSMTLSDSLDIQEGYTTFIIEGVDSVVDIAKNYDKYFACNRQAVVSNMYGKVYNAVERGISRVYFKGVKVGEFTSDFPYDFQLSEVELNEVREIKHETYVLNDIGKTIEGSTLKSFTRKWIDGLHSGDTFNTRVCLSNWHMETYASELLLEFIANNTFYNPSQVAFFDLKPRKSSIPLCEKALERFTKLFPEIEIDGVNKLGSDSMVEKEITSGQSKAVESAVDLLLDSNYKTRLMSEIKFCDFSKDSTMAKADCENKIMWISRTAIDNYSSFKLASIIIEEQEHIITGHSDCTREFQTHLFELLTKQLLS